MKNTKRTKTILNRKNSGVQVQDSNTGGTFTRPPPQGHTQPILGLSEATGQRVAVGVVCLVSQGFVLLTICSLL